MAKTALIIIDVQPDFLPGGALAVPGGDEILKPLDALAAGIGVIVVTQDWHPKRHGSFASSHGADPFTTAEMPYGTQVLWPDHCVQGTPGAELALPGHILNKTQIILRKGTNPALDSYSGFLENDRTTPTGLAGWLRERGIKHVLLAGLALDYCVSYTALDAVALGFEVTVAIDACRGIAADSIRDQIAKMSEAGVSFAETGSLVAS